MMSRGLNIGHAVRPFVHETLLDELEALTMRKELEESYC